MRKRTYLRDVIKARSPLRRAIRIGMAAFASHHTRLVASSERPRIGDSLDLDTASRDELPQANRWDYILSLPDLAEIVGIEAHAAKDSEVLAVIAKKDQAVQYLRHHLEDGCRVRGWFWVSEGPVSFSRTERARRRLDQHGIAFEGHVLRSFGPATL